MNRTVFVGILSVLPAMGLNKYKSEYEALIADAKKLIEKQKKTDDAMNKIMETCNNELQNLIEMKGR